MTELNIEYSQNDDEVIERSGWLYADLFLALTVIFLATISFVPENSNPANVESENLSGQTNLNVKGNLTLKVKLDELDAVAKEVLNYVSSNSKGGSIEVVFAQIIGGYNSKTETIQQGQLRALKFAIDLGAKYPDILMNSQRYIDGDENIDSGEIGLRLTFGQKLDAKKTN